MRSQWSLLAALLLPLALAAQHPDGLAVRLRTPTGQTVFHQGEAIHLVVAFTSTVANRYWLEISSVDSRRSCARSLYGESLHVTPGGGWSDPLRQFYGGTCAFSILSSDHQLTIRPTVLDIAFHQWVRFDRPGSYSVTFTAAGAVRQSAQPYAPGAPTVAVASPPLQLTIVKADAAWQAATVLQAQAILQRYATASPPPSGLAEPGRSGVQSALERLAALGTPAAARALAQWAGNPTVAGQWEQAIAETGHVDDGLSTLRALMADPERPVDADFLNGMAVLSGLGDPAPPWLERVEVAAELYRNLPAKHGQALVQSLAAAAGFEPDAAPVALRPWLTQTLADHFQELSESERAAAIAAGAVTGAPLAGPAALALVRQAASGLSSGPARAAALRRWYALAPDEARPAVIAAILSVPAPADAAALGFLPDPTLPEADATLLSQIEGPSYFAGPTNAVSLLARYASPAIAGAVAQALDQHSGWPCERKAALLGYLLRAHPQLAAARLDAALAHPGCGGYMLVQMAAIHNAPELEHYALAHLDDAAEDIATDCADYLRRFGGAAAEAALLRRYQALDDDDATTPSQLRSALWQALLSGQAWLCGPVQIRQLRASTRQPRLVANADSLLAAWQRPPWPIRQNGQDGFTLLQYDGNLSDIESKLQQFNPGSTFAWPGPETPAAQQLAAFLASHAMRLVP